MELFIEQIDNEILRDKKKRKAEGYSVERREDRGCRVPMLSAHYKQTGRSHLYKKFSNFTVNSLLAFSKTFLQKLDTNVVRRPIYFYKKMWYYIYGD